MLFLRYVWLRYAISFVSHWIPENLAIVLAPWMGKITIDHVVLGAPVEDVTGYPSFLIPVVQMLEGASAGLIMTWMALLTVVGLVARLGHRYAMALFDIRIEQSIVHLVRSRLFESVQSLPMTKLDDQPIGDSVYRVMNDTEVIPGIISTVVQQPVFAVSTFAVALATMLSAYPDSPAVAFFAVGALPMYLLVIAPFARMLRRRAQAMLASQSAFTSNIEEGMDNMLAVQGLALPPIEEGVSFRQAGFVYPDGRRALKDVTFNARMGQIMAIVGPTGAGKTTLAYLIPRYHAASEGQVLIDGHDVNDVTIESLRGQISYVFQETQTTVESILENIRLGKPHATTEEVERAARTAGIHDFIVSLPDGYDTMLGASSSKLSVGQKQRIGIARGLVKDSRVLIPDEPTSALDPQTEEHFVNALDEAAKDRTVIVIAHRLSTVAVADHVVFLDEGRVLEEGTHTELMARARGNYRRFVDLQTSPVD